MIVIMNSHASAEQLENVQSRLKEFGFDIHLSKGVERTIIGAIGDKKPEVIQSLESMEGVDRVVPILQPYKLAGREFRTESTQVKVGSAVFGGPQVVTIAGPCAVESLDQLLETARGVKAAGAQILRGGAYKPRTSPYAFQGLEEEGLKILKAAREATGMAFVTEIVNPRDVELVQEYTDMLQIGARNMQNFTLLREVGKARKPVLLKRGLSATIEEWLMAAEYIMSEGNYEIVLCERGIRTFETATRNTFDVSAIPIVKKQSHLPIIADPSHASGKRHLVLPLALAAVAAGADGLMIEVHPNPEKALSDGPQSLTPDQFGEILTQIRPVAEAVGRSL